jgi:fluoride exporter
MTAGFPWAQLLAIAVGSTIGAWLRWASGLWLNGRWMGFPLGTLLVNTAGGLMIGLALAYLERSPNEMLRLLLVTGFLGGLTTFSAFSGESLTLLQRGEWGMALLHTLAHVLGALACAAIGFRLGRVFFG